jgi:hypothetical protein
MLSSLMWYGERYSTPIRSDIANLSESAFACNAWATTITLEEEEEEEEERIAAMGKQNSAIASSAASE